MDVETIKIFLNKKNTIAFVGATKQKEKWGYRKYKEIKDAGFKVYPVNPRYDEVDGDRCFPNLKSLIEFQGEKPDFVITIIPSKVTEKTVEQCKIFGIDKIWMQPGSESEKAIRFCEENNITVVHGICIVVDALQKL
ncbi:MAG: CoA-binding protein [Thermoplasmatales archaeon]|nr:CoA-binding protein [Thermoplasmatales archaeon]